MAKTSQTTAAAAHVPVPTINLPTSPSQCSEAVSIVSPSEYLAARPYPRAGNASQAPPTNPSAPLHADENQPQSQSQSQSQFDTPTPTKPIYIFPHQPRRRDIERLAPLGYEPSKGYLGSLWQPVPGQIHHRADQVSHYRRLGTRGWECFQQRRLALSQAEIGVIDKAWAANGGGVILDFGVKKRRGWRGMELSTIREEDEWEDEEGKRRDERRDERRRVRR